MNAISSVRAVKISEDLINTPKEAYISYCIQTERQMFSNNNLVCAISSVPCNDLFDTNRVLIKLKNTVCSVLFVVENVSELW